MPASPSTPSFPSDPTQSPIHISPSKALHAARSAKDWSIVHTYLTRLYHPSPVPVYERNESTLSALLALSSWSEEAEERAGLVDGAREEGARNFRGRGKGEGDGDVRTGILREVEGSLDERAYQVLGDMGEAAAVMGVATTSSTTDVDNGDGDGDITTSLAHSIIQLTREEATLSQRANRVSDLRATLDAELSRLRSQLEDLTTDPGAATETDRGKSNAYSTPRHLPSQTAEYSRATRVLSTKVGEYSDRLSALDEKVRATGLDRRGIERIGEKEVDVLAARERVKALEGRLAAFEGLPVDIEGARDVYDRLVGELRGLEGRRDGLFEGLVS
jgi:HAUS augmin-like complex subunit 1